MRVCQLVSAGNTNSFRVNDERSGVCGNPKDSKAWGIVDGTREAHALRIRKSKRVVSLRRHCGTT